MERLGFRFEGVSAQYPKLDDLNIIVDDGGNDVLTASCRDALASWVRAGGVLIVFPHTGAYTLDGSRPTLAGALGLKFEVHPARSHETFNVGGGRVIVLPSVPSEKDSASIDRLERLLIGLGAVRDVEIRPRVNNACFRAEGKTYLVVFNKSRKHVGAFFRESTLAAAEEALPDLVLTVKPNFRFSSAKDVVNGNLLESRNGEVEVNLPATHFRVMELVH